MTIAFPAVPPPADVAADPRVIAAGAAFTAWLATPGGQACAAAGADPLAVPGSDLLACDQLTPRAKRRCGTRGVPPREAGPFTARGVTAALRGLFPHAGMSSRALGGGQVRVRLPVTSANELGVTVPGAAARASAWLSGSSAPRC
jgi:hypothetical protein